MMRTSTLIGCVPPTRSNSCSWMTRRSLAWRSRRISEISSSSSVPPSARSNALALAHELARRGQDAPRAPNRLVFGAQPDHLERLAERDLQRIDLHGLREVVDRAGLDRRDGVLDAREARHDDDGHRVPVAL